MSEKTANGHSVDSLINRLLMRSSAGREAIENCEDPKEVRKYILHLPSWGDAVRGAPNEFLRSALFRPTNRNIKRSYLKDEAIAIIGDGEIRYTGEELRQDDEPVWLQLIHWCRGKPIGEPVEFRPVSMLRAIRRCNERNPSSRDYKWLSDTITRLTATAVVITSHRLKTKLGLSMVRRFVYQDNDGNRLPLWRVWIEPEVVDLFGGVYYTQVEWSMRLSLPSGLSTWLLGFLSTHRNPYPVKIDTIMRTISRYNSTSENSIYNFRKDLSNALDELVAVGFLSSYTIDKFGLIHVQRKA